MNIEMSELVGLIKSVAGGESKQSSCFVEASSFWVVGKEYFIRTDTFHDTGRLVAIEGSELIFDRAAWIADSGRFSVAMDTGEFNEVEVWPDDRRVLINRLAIRDACEAPAGSPRSTK